MKEFGASQFAVPDLARQEARKLQGEYPLIFEKSPVNVYDLANSLKIAVHEYKNLKQRAILEVTEQMDSREEKISVRAGQSESVNRFAVAHEIGHAILIKNHPNDSRGWATERREEFANVFAAEILIPSGLRPELAELFRRAADPLALVRLASRLGLTPRALLTFANRELSWMAGLEKIWLRVSHTENAFTHTDPRLRIVSAYYDRERFFVATNQSLARFAGSEDWLVSMPVGVVARRSGSINVSARRPRPASPKFLLVNLTAEITAVKFHSGVAGNPPYLIVLADFSGKEMSPIRGAS